MKRFVKGICLMGMVALLATSCNKNKETKVYRIAMDPSETTFAVEQGEWDNNDRVYIDINGTYQVTFEDGDQVMFFNIDETTPANSEAAVYTVVNGGVNAATIDNLDGSGVSAMKDAYYAFYPGDNVSLDLANENRAILPVDSVQNYRPQGIPAGALYMAAKIDDANNDLFAFRNICGIFQVQFYSAAGKTVKSIKLTNNGMNISGDVTLKVPAVDPAELTTTFRTYIQARQDGDAQGIADGEAAIAQIKNDYGFYVDNADNTIRLDCGNGVALGTTLAEATSFYFVLRPLALMTGFELELTFSDNSTKTIRSTKADRNTIKPSTFRVFPALSAD